jgi:hypothetical protein
MRELPLQLNIVASRTVISWGFQEEAMQEPCVDEEHFVKLREVKVIVR